MGAVLTALDAATQNFGMLTDAKPDLMSKKAQDNVNGHFPSGGT